MSSIDSPSFSSTTRVAFSGHTVDGTQSAVPGRVRLRTLVRLRWLAVAGQTLAVLGVYFGAGFSLPLWACLAVISASAVLNVVVSIRFPVSRRLSNREAAFYLGFDLVQLFALLLLTGGITNPFSLLFLAPVAISATSLDIRSTIALGALSFVSITVLALYHLPLPWPADTPLELQGLYVWGLWAALVLGLGFTAGYAWRIATEDMRMRDALEATRAALARENRLAALGGLAAAAAHELGTPLATIALVAKELEREVADDSPFAEDIKLLRTQATRCREILGELSRRPGEGDAMTSFARCGALLEEIVTPHRGFGIEIEVRCPGTDGFENAEGPKVWRHPEIIHGLGNLVENAVDFAKSKVVAEARWGTDTLSVVIKDDGPGFAPEIMAELGEPYVSTRRAENLAEDADPDEAIGMGLGFFIAKNLLERTGAHLDVQNVDDGGAEITVTWPRGGVEVLEEKETGNSLK